MPVASTTRAMAAISTAIALPSRIDSSELCANDRLGMSSENTYSATAAGTPSRMPRQMVSPGDAPHAGGQIVGYETVTCRQLPP